MPNYHNMRQAWMATVYDEEAVGGEEGGPDLEAMDGEGRQDPSERQEGNTQHAEGDSQHLHLADQPSTRRGIAFYIECMFISCYKSCSDCYLYKIASKAQTVPHLTVIRISIGRYGGGKAGGDGHVPGNGHAPAHCRELGRQILPAGMRPERRSSAEMG